MKEKRQVYAIVRLDGELANMPDAIAVKEVLPSLQEAKIEVDRLNDLNSGKGVIYLFQATRYFPSGRNPGRR